MKAKDMRTITQRRTESESDFMEIQCWTLDIWSLKPITTYYSLPFWAAEVDSKKLFCFDEFHGGFLQ